MLHDYILGHRHRVSLQRSRLDNQQNGKQPTQTHAATIVGSMVQLQPYLAKYLDASINVMDVPQIPRQRKTRPKLANKYLVLSTQC